MKVPYWLLAALFHCLTISAASATDLAEKPLVIEAKIDRQGEFMRSGFGYVWMMAGAKLVRVDPSDNSFTEHKLARIQGPFRSIAMGEGAVWVPDVGTDLIHKFDLASSTVTLTIPAEMSHYEGSIGVGEGAVWVDEKLALRRFNASSGAEEARIELPSEGAGVVVAFGSVWVAAPRKDELYRIDPKTNALTQTIALKTRPRFLAADENSVWVLDHGGFVQGVDGKTGEVTATIETGPMGGGGDIDAGGGFVWLTTLDITLMQIHAKTKSIVARFRDKNIRGGICFGGGAVWMSGSAIYRVKVQ